MFVDMVRFGGRRRFRGSGSDSACLLACVVGGAGVGKEKEKEREERRG